MTKDSVTYEELLEARAKLINFVQTALTKEERRFLLSLKAGEPEWEQLGVEGVEALPWIQWKLRNIRVMHSGKRKTAYKRLAEILGE